MFFSEWFWQQLCIVKNCPLTVYEKTFFVDLNNKINIDVVLYLNNLIFNNNFSYHNLI